jgi:hypothetical protein
LKAGNKYVVGQAKPVVSSRSPFRKYHDSELIAWVIKAGMDGKKVKSTEVADEARNMRDRAWRRHQLKPYLDASEVADFDEKSTTRFGASSSWASKWMKDMAPRIERKIAPYSLPTRAKDLSQGAKKLLCMTTPEKVGVYVSKEESIGGQGELVTEKLSKSYLPLKAFKSIAEVLKTQTHMKNLIVYQNYSMGKNAEIQYIPANVPTVGAEISKIRGTPANGSLLRI